jgi:hypothetical protein
VSLCRTPVGSATFEGRKVFIGMHGPQLRRLYAGVIAGLLACTLVGPINTSASPAATKRYYMGRKPALKVTLTIYKHHVYRASVTATGVCSDGERSSAIGYAITGGAGLPIRGQAHRFRKSIVGTTNSMVFRGRVEGDKVVGSFKQMYREEPPQPGGKEEVPGRRCGSGSSPSGELLHFVARAVSANRIPPSMR